MARKRLLDKPDDDRPVYKRMTVVFGAIMAALVGGGKSLEATGQVPPGTTDTAGMAIAESLAALGVLVGLYRQVAN